VHAVLESGNGEDTADAATGAPPPLLSSAPQTVSVPSASSRVPPQASTLGLEAGKSTLAVFTVASVESV